MADLSKIKLNGTDYNLKDAEAREELSKKMPIVEFGEETVLIDTTTVEFSKDGDNDWFISTENPLNGFTKDNFLENILYKITWDNVEYEVFYILQIGIDGDYNFDWKTIGNTEFKGYSVPYETNAPFCIATNYQREATNYYIFAFDTSSSHTIKIVTIPFVKQIIPEQYYKYIDEGRPIIFQGTGTLSTIQGLAEKSSGKASHAEGGYTVASGDYSHAEGTRTTASGNFSHAEGAGNIASNRRAHAEGVKTVASGDTSHSEGCQTTASGNYSHAEGLNTIASNNVSHSEGRETTASGNYSHAEGLGTTAQRRSQHTFGEYNILDATGTATDKGAYVEIVGNGTSDSARSNARTLDWSGNETLAGKLTLGSAPTADMDAATKEYVDTAVSGITVPVTSVNGQTGDVSLTIPTVPTNVSSFTNDAGYQNSTQVNSAITTAIGNINSFDVEVVASTSSVTTPNSHTIYFVPQAVNSSVHDEYMYINNNWELIGTTTVDLSGYLQKTEIADWAKASTKPTYTASEVGAMSTSHPANAITSADITNWNGKSTVQIVRW